MYYKHLDKRLTKLKKQIKKLFLRYKATMKFDEINVIRSTKELYKELQKLNEEAFLDIANDIYREEFPESKERLDKKWLMAILLAYDPITKYVYEHEVDRKQARLYEAVLSSKTPNKEFMTAFNLWFKQTAQYGITISDSAIVEAFKRQGIEYVRWNAEIDDRTCGVCKERNGKIYRIDKIPSKTHYNCRCWLTKVEK